MTTAAETSARERQRHKMAEGRGFIAALDQSGGSTPGALAHYGIDRSAYSGDEEMFDLMHEMRSRIAESPRFDGRFVLGAILFENTMDRSIAGRPAAEYLWGEKEIVPFLKVDKGLAPLADGVQLMKPIPDLDPLLDRGVAKGIFGTKMRSFIGAANPQGVTEIVDQQFELGRRILDKGLVPILEPEVDINSPDKAEAEELLKQDVLGHLGSLGADEVVMLKVSIPDVDDLYAELIAHPKVLRVVALSGGYSQEEACARLRRNHGLIASFSRALTEGLSAGQSAEEFDATLGASVQQIYDASIT